MYGTQNHPTYFMPHSVQPELASCQCGDPCWVSLGIFFTSALSFFSFFSLHLPQPLRHFSLHWAVGERKDQAFQFLFTDSFLMLVCFFLPVKKMYPYSFHLNTLWNSPCGKQTDIMLCALQVVALLICCFPNNSRFFYFASVFVASCYLLAKTKQASLVSKAFHQLSHQHFASLVSFAFVLCLLHSH